MKLCDMDCLNCKYDDCINDALPTKSEDELLRKSLETTKQEKKRLSARERLKKSYDLNKEKKQAYQRDYYAKNREKISKQRKERREIEKEAVKSKSKE